eukprot:c8788_g1_i3.p1 GENE.c8788_g1_i3~~c8788_g1_i3.p1  ORF type:complete len:148 (+),score=30.49 c8788_g1_i3:212-655(+)
MPKNRRKIKKISLKDPYWMVPKNSRYYELTRWPDGTAGTGDINQVPDYKTYFANLPKAKDLPMPNMNTVDEGPKGTFQDRESGFKYKMVFGADDEVAAAAAEASKEAKDKAGRRKKATKRLRKTASSAADMPAEKPAAEKPAAEKKK